MSKVKLTKNRKESDSDQDYNIENLNDLMMDNPLKDDKSDDLEFINNSDFSDEIDQKINDIYEKNKDRKQITPRKESLMEIDKKGNEIKKKKYDKKIMAQNFNDYFDASHKDIEDYYQVNYPELNNYDLKFDLYSDLFKLIDKKKIFNFTKNNEEYNAINEGNLFYLMYELLYHNYNIFLYGFGNKSRQI